MDAIILVLAVLALIVGSVALSYRLIAQRGPPLAQDTPRTCAGCAEVVTRQAQLESEFQAVRAAVAEGIEHVERVENRIRGTIKRARKELRDGGLESPGLEAEVASLSLVDGGGGEGPSMPLLPEPVEQPQSSVPGVSPEQLRRVRGL